MGCHYQAFLFLQEKKEKKIYGKFFHGMNIIEVLISWNQALKKRIFKRNKQSMKSHDTEYTIYQQPNC